MKNIFKVLSIACIGAAFTACVDDVDTPDRGEQVDPVPAVEGVYEGTWTLVYTENTTVTEYTCDGKLTVAPLTRVDDEGNSFVQKFAANITVDADFANNVGQSMVDFTSAANISPLTNALSYQMYNSVTPNGLSKIAKDPDGTVVTYDTKVDDVDVTLDRDINATFMGQIFPYTAEGELTKAAPAYLEAVLEFEYLYQKTVMNGRRPVKLDCKQTYKFVGKLNK
ncbi:MAG: hypothetical protein K2L14_04520 [Duncaniella sp.]|nr:hypothetical protein [Duncaniella sp.]